MKTKNVLLFTLFYLGVLFTSVGQSTILVLQPDATQGKDAQLSSGNSTNNYGNLTYFGGRVCTNSVVPNQARGLLDFDLSALPDNAQILEAKLTLTPFITGNNNPMTVTNNITICRVITSWEEHTVTYGFTPGMGGTMMVPLRFGQ